MDERTASPIRFGSSIGQPLTRRDGELKVTGAAMYAADHHPANMLYAALAESTIARGRVLSLNIEAAKAHPGVVDVMTPANKPALARDPDDVSGAMPFLFKMDLLQNDNVRYPGQPIAVCIAETLEAAIEGAALLQPVYESESARVLLEDAEPFIPPKVGVIDKPLEEKGEIGAGLTASVHTVSATYCTPTQYHNALEPHAVIASWDGDKLHLDTPSQGMTMAQMRLAGLFGIPPANIFIRSPFLGGGFGSKGVLWSPQILGVMAARLVQRPVKLVLSRGQMFGSVGHRAPSRQLLRMGTDAEGGLLALDHDTRTTSSTFDDFYEPTGRVSHVLYKTPALRTAYDAVRLDTGTPFFMRAPGEASGSVALESAIDEMANACGMDPLAFRLKNYAETEPMTGRPFSSKALRECYEQAAARFGWESRPLAPRMMKDDQGLLFGWGMGTSTYPVVMPFPAEAVARLHPDGSATVEIGSMDMGQGAWTALHQIAADELGLDMERVVFRMGSSDLPSGGAAGASAQTAIAGTAIFRAAESAIQQLAVLASGDQSSPLYRSCPECVFARGGRLVRKDDESKFDTYSAILTRVGSGTIEGRGRSQPFPPEREAFAMHSHGAVFAEVKVDPDVGQVRVTRLVGAFAAGRIVNPRLVLSQYYGGMIWGTSFALQEHAVIDRRSGRIMNNSLAEYHIPVCADLPSIEAILVDEHDPHVNPIGVKGVGEVGITGTSGAIANAIWHATGKRVRTFPVAIESLIEG